MVQNVAATEAWAALLADPQAHLIDVRTDAEWQFVGIPDLRPAGKQPVLIPWQYFPSGALNAGFTAALRQAGLEPSHPLYFLCRSGARSLAAAQAAEAEGFAQVFNIADGFEGPPDRHGHRGSLAGWKAADLPWTQ